VTRTKTTLYLDQNYLSGIAKRKPAFAELEPILREAVANGTLAVLESKVHARESKPRPDLRHQAELFSGRRRDVIRLRERIQRGVRCAADGAADRKFHR
jgi:hypothetical protein